MGLDLNHIVKGVCDGPLTIWPLRYMVHGGAELFASPFTRTIRPSGSH